MTAVLNQEYRVTPLTEVQLHPKNPRRADVEDLQESLQENGFYGAIIVQRGTNFVLAGNHRVQAAVAEGLTELPMIWVDADDELATKILLADNRYADKAGYDDKQLLSILEELNGMDSLAGTGFDQTAIEDLERVTGQLAQAQSGFLDDIANRARAATQGGPGASEDPLAGSGVGGIKPQQQFFSVSYLVSSEERALILRVLAAIKDRQDLESGAQALIALCTAKAEELGIGIEQREPEGEAAPDDLA